MVIYLNLLRRKVREIASSGLLRRPLLAMTDTWEPQW